MFAGIATSNLALHRRHLFTLTIVRLATFTMIKEEYI